MEKSMEYRWNVFLPPPSPRRYPGSGSEGEDKSSLQGALEKYRPHEINVQVMRSNIWGLKVPLSNIRPLCMFKNDTFRYLNKHKLEIMMPNALLGSMFVKFIVFVCFIITGENRVAERSRESIYVLVNEQRGCLKEALLSTTQGLNSKIHAFNMQPVFY